MLVDIHNHILPGLDDGPNTMEEAILLAADAVANGVTHIIATPHHMNGKYQNASAVVVEAVANLNREIANRSIPVQILPGQEIHFYNSILDDLNENLLTLSNSGKFLLLELPSNYFPAFTFEILLEIQLKGFIPIIVHPERNRLLKKDKQKVYELVKKGALIQITAASLVGVHGYSVKKYLKDLIKHNLVHFISSDAHHYTKRPFLLKLAYQYVGKRFSQQLVNSFQENAKNIITGTAFPTLPPITFKKKRRFLGIIKLR